MPHTPGPWTVLVQGTGVSIVHVEKHPDKTGGHRICRMHSGKPNLHDDAHLIAAGPALLAALKATRSRPGHYAGCTHPGTPCPTICTTIRAAIALAERGETSDAPAG